MPTLTKEALAGVRRLVGCMTRLVTENGMIGSPALSNLQTTHNGKITERTEAHKGEEQGNRKQGNPLEHPPTPRHRKQTFKTKSKREVKHLTNPPNPQQHV